MRQDVWTRAATAGTAALLAVVGTGGVAVAEDDEAPQAPVVTSAEYPDDDTWHDGARNVPATDPLIRLRWPESAV
ncbi:hypothetical protein [Streptomyces canus]|uniref:hypothetical protein n=1 Tax=Streptomyces canus TaxID=58343 RepID=UPI00224FFCB1|nr:hypothetical protein [Streptomyces canus]MCX4857659.1 hypothetical protein [Streptomyces canus]